MRRSARMGYHWRGWDGILPAFNQTPFEDSMLRALICPIVLFLAACSSGSSGASANIAGELQTGPAGGTLTITSGPLAGVTLTIPANAITLSETVTAREAVFTQQDGFLDVGPAAAFEPADLPLASPGELVLTFDPTRVPEGVRDEEFLVLVRALDGTITEVIPLSIDRAAGTVTLTLDALATAWVVIPLVDVNATSVDLQDYLPLTQGNRFELSSANLNLNVEVAMQATFGEILRFDFGVFAREESFRFDGNGDLVTDGWGALSFEVRHDAAVPYAINQQPFGIEEVFDTTFQLFDPASSPTSTGFGFFSGRSLVTRVDPAEAPMLTGFRDVVQLAVQRTWLIPFQASVAVTEFLFLAKGVGLVGYQDYDGTQYSFVRAVVDGATIER